MENRHNNSPGQALQKLVHHSGIDKPIPFTKALSCARQGFRYAVSTQRNFKIHAVIGCLAVFLGFSFSVSAVEWCAIVICIALVFAAEFMNTAIECTIDLLSPEWNELAKRAKDCAAAGVYMTALGSLVIALIIFLPKLFAQVM